MKINTLLLTMGLCLMVPIITIAQDSTASSALSFSVGFNALRNKDRFQSPYTYKGTNLLIQSAYTRFQSKGQHRIELTYSAGNLKSIISPEAKTTLVRVHYDYLFSLKTKTTAQRLFPSLGVGLHTLLSKVNYLPGIEAPTHYLSAGAFLTLSGQLRYTFNKRSSIVVQAALPVVGLVYRPDFEINGKTLTKVALPGKGYLFDAALEYSYAVTPKLKITATYQYSYFTFNEPRAVNILQNGFLFGLKRTF